MVDGRQRSEWSKLASLMVNARLAMHNPRHIDIEALIPPQFRAERIETQLTPEQEEARAAAAWEVMGEFFFANKVN
jgi:hypothetical protein